MKHFSKFFNNSYYLDATTYGQLLVKGLPFAIIFTLVAFKQWFSIRNFNSPIDVLIFAVFSIGLIFFIGPFAVVRIRKEISKE